MWLITEHGFISLVQDRKDHSKVWVRARVKEDIAKTFPAFADEIITKIGADYIYRLIIPKDVAALAMWNAVQDLDYDSHAKEVMNRRSHPNPKRMSAYYKIWNALAELQPFAPYAHQPRSAYGIDPKKSQPALTFSSREPAWTGEEWDEDKHGFGHRTRRADGHYDWSKHPQSKATGFRNGQPIESYEPSTHSTGTAIELDTDALATATDDLTDAQLLGMNEEDFEDYILKNETAHRGPKGKRNPRRRGRGGRK